jgi:hypothetical protein
MSSTPKEENNWTWCEQHASRIGAVSYFNSIAHSVSGRIWSLDEKQTMKMTTFRSLLTKPTCCTLAR